ncbi:MAG: LamG domain-containing protein, partial [Paramuribaculum sp.]|nr:LamG domain-containing protein [Paramuribaculum sp.]
MRKFLLLLCGVMLMPVLALADNMALHKTMSSLNAFTQYRLMIPYEALGYGSIPASGMAGDESYTYAMWVKVTGAVSTSATASSQGGVLASFGTMDHENYNGNWVFCVQDNGKVTVSGHGDGQHGCGVGFSSIVCKNFPMNEWVYFAVVVDNANLKVSVYYNDELAGEATLSSAMYYPWQDGKFQAGCYGLTCDLDEVQMYNAALTAQQISVAQNSPRALSSLQALYTFDEHATGSSSAFDNVLANGNTTQAQYYQSAARWLDAGGGIINCTNTLKDAELIASDRVIAPVEVTVTVADVENGSLVLKNGEEEVASGATVAAGTELTLEAVPADGYKLVAVTANGEV